MAGITTADVRAFITARLEAKASPGEINRELSLLKRMFYPRRAGRQALRSSAHSHAGGEQRPRRGSSSGSSLTALRTHLPDAVQPVVTFAYVTGWRIRSEVLTLQWRQVDLDAGTVRLGPRHDEERRGPRVPPDGGTSVAARTAEASIRDEYQRRTRQICPWVFHRHGKRIVDFRQGLGVGSKGRRMSGPHPARSSTNRRA